MLWVLAFHLIFLVAWFAGLFYLPRLFIYHLQAQDRLSQERFKIMEKKLYFYITTPAGIVASLFGIWLLFFNLSGFFQARWMYAKLFLVLLLWIFHLYCGRLLFLFKKR